MSYGTVYAIAAKHVYPDHTGSDSRGTGFSRTFELMPSEPMRRSHCTLEPLLSRPGERRSPARVCTGIHRVGYGCFS